MNKFIKKNKKEERKGAQGIGREGGPDPFRRSQSCWAEKSQLSQQKHKLSVPSAPGLFFTPLREAGCLGAGWVAGFLTEESQVWQMAKRLAGTGGLQDISLKPCSSLPERYCESCCPLWTALFPFVNQRGDWPVPHLETRPSLSEHLFGPSFPHP